MFSFWKRMRARRLGKLIAAAVQSEIERQKRPGGLLSVEDRKDR